MKGIEAALTARLSRDAEARTTKNGHRMVALNAAVDEGGEGATTWVKILCFHDQADAAATLTKGCLIYAEGRLRLETWTGRDDVQRTGLTVLARLVQPLGQMGRRRPPKRPQRADKPADGGGAPRGENRPLRDDDGMDWERGDPLPFGDVP
jgi:single-stranded DNA-binding protein